VKRFKFKRVFALETNGNNLEPEFEALLKRQVQGARHDAPCHQFDPDIASAYLERALTERALTTYEKHLASCVSCRRDLVALSRLLPPQPPLMSVEPVITQKSLSERVGEWFSGWRLGALAGFGAVAATALLVATIAIRPSQESASPMIAEKQKSAQATPEPMPAAVATDELKRQSSPAPTASVAANVRLEDQTIAKATPPVTQPVQPLSAGQVGSAVSAPPPAVISAPTKEEAERKETIAADQLSVARQNQMQNLRAQVPSGPELNQLQMDRAMERARKDNEKANSDATAEAMAAPRPASRSAEKPAERTVEKEGAATDAVTEPNKSKQAEMRAISTVKSSASRSKIVSGKTFRQENGIWIDETYDASKVQSTIRLTHDSEAYKQTLKDIPALKPFFDLKPVIVVWQGKVYRVEK
jgi:hypothetical protein